MSYHHQNVLKRKYMNHLIAMVIVKNTQKQLLTFYGNMPKTVNNNYIIYK